MKGLEADVIVVAAGVAGLAASIAAAEKGAQVIVFEKASTTGGTGNMGMGPLGVESRLQRLKKIGPSKEEAFKVFMDYTHWQVDAQLVGAYLEKATTTIDWLEKMGIEFLEPRPYFPGGWPTWHVVNPGEGKPGGGGCAATMFRIMTEKAKGMGVQFFLQTPVEKIIKQGDKVAGVTAEDRTGKTIQADAKAVIIATGGFGDNPQWIKKYTGYEWGRDLQSFRVPGLAGDGIRMAWEVGAAPTEMRMELIYLMPGELDPELAETFRQPHLLLNLLGERFMNEETMANPAFTGNAISRQKNRAAFLIFDENIKKHMESVGFDLLQEVFPFTKVSDLDALMKNAFKASYKDIFVADSLEELTGKTGIDPDGLKRTIEEYNGFCRKGLDPIFNKNPKLLRPITTPKYYAGKFLPGAYGSLGGIKINYKTEVLNKDWKKIPGLYAAGTDACSIYGDTYVFILPGNTMGFALNSGRIAGENAAAYAQSAGK
ncbi:MAG: fumarate reductase [Deltaproteobacteria bacterium RBG_13_52_11]|nr:MAG: fumarate reductase [Deltaproteobacteria bacterium RBG_13_52_11]